jgi:hypothetical protein
MALRVLLYLHGEVVDGVEQWWDDVDLLLTSRSGDFRVLETISPYGRSQPPRHLLPDLAAECRRLGADAKGSTAALLLRISELAERAVSTDGAELVFDGD